MSAGTRAPGTSAAGGLVSWDAFAGAAPDLADTTLGILGRSGILEGFLATVRGEGLPRIHPVYLGIVDGRLLAVVLAGSAKLRDLREDGRFALHAHQDPAVPHELLIRGRASETSDPGLRNHAASAWSFAFGDADGVFELRIGSVTHGSRPDADAWPPVYRSWTAQVLA